MSSLLTDKEKAHSAKVKAEKEVVAAHNYFTKYMFDYFGCGIQIKGGLLKVAVNLGKSIKQYIEAEDKYFAIKNPGRGKK